MSQFEAPRYECTKHVIHLNTEEIVVFDVLCSIASLFLARTIAGWFGHWVGSARNERCSSSPEISHVRRITHTGVGTCLGAGLSLTRPLVSIFVAFRPVPPTVLSTARDRFSSFSFILGYAFCLGCASFVDVIRRSVPRC